ncbi:hypothetical protein ACH4Y0_02675 [Streptomyces sp. NPDC020707]|uniref:hypothetical protein n=1 Tax=Streptomyces sp. NPDC020707 TaxID=3365084 RepID=UPI0037A0A0D0
MDTEDRIYVGSRVTYYGSLAEYEGRTFLALPCQYHCPDRCRLDANPARFGLTGPAAGLRLDHVRETSISPAPHDWPADGIPMKFGSHWYMGAYTSDGGSGRARTLHFHTASPTAPYGEAAFHWRSLASQKFLDAVRRLDRQSIGYARITY